MADSMSGGSIAEGPGTMTGGSPSVPRETSAASLSPWRRCRRRGAEEEATDSSACWLGRLLRRDLRGGI